MSGALMMKLRFVLVTIAVSLIGLELFLLLLRHQPALSVAPPVAVVARELYMLDRHMIQFEEQAARWDRELGYVLRPGTFRFANTEFDTGYQVNQKGLRDDEASLDKPAIVVVGDSFAMGWGVEQDEAFPQLLEVLSRRAVLNAAIASYGTARQLRLLGELELSAARHLVIQFCNNDYFENLAFDREGPQFHVQDRAGYSAAVADYRRMRRYWPGRYSFILLGRRLGRGAAAPDHPDPSDPANQRRQAELFINVLVSSPVDLSRLEIITFELNSHNRHGELFIPALRQVIADGEYPPFIEHMVAVDLAAELGPNLFFRLDDHITTEGHRHIAQRLWEIIQTGELQVTRSTLNVPTRPSGS